MSKKCVSGPAMVANNDEAGSHIGKYNKLSYLPTQNLEKLICHVEAVNSEA